MVRGLGKVPLPSPNKNRGPVRFLRRADNSAVGEKILDISEAPAKAMVRCQVDNALWSYADRNPIYNTGNAGAGSQDELANLNADWPVSALGP